MSNNKTEQTTDISLTDILQAHDILMSILLGKILGNYKNPHKVIGQIRKMVDHQDINANAKSHIKLLLDPLKNSFPTNEN